MKDGVILDIFGNSGSILIITQGKKQVSGVGIGTAAGFVEIGIGTDLPNPGEKEGNVLLTQKMGRNTQHIILGPVVCFSGGDHGQCVHEIGIFRFIPHQTLKVSLLNFDGTGIELQMGENKRQMLRLEGHSAQEHSVHGRRVEFAGFIGQNRRDPTVQGSVRQMEMPEADDRKVAFNGA